MNESTPESETPEEMGRRKFLVRASGIMAAPLAVVIGYSLVVSLVGNISLCRQSREGAKRVVRWLTSTDGVGT